jgi:hypothetical protein
MSAEHAPRKRPGRPRIDPSCPSVGVHFKLSAKQYDLVYQAARQARLDVPSYIRTRLPRPEPDR